jgi:hypothetical protein
LSVTKKIPTDRSLTPTQLLKRTNNNLKSNVASCPSSPCLASQVEDETSFELSDFAKEKNPSLLDISEDDAINFLNDGHKAIASLLNNKQHQVIADIET